jgi:hypothetical protein
LGPRARGLQGLNWNSQIVIDATNDWVADDLRGEHQVSSSPTSWPARGSSKPPTLSAGVLGSDPHEAGGSA